MNIGTITKVGRPLMIAMAIGFILSPVRAQENSIPWKFGGYNKIDALHLKYWSASGDALENAENFKKPDFESEISELWYSKALGSFRVDKYVAKKSMLCNQFKGKEWESITENGKVYVLKERIIHSDTNRISYSLQNIQSGGGTELCEYKKSEGKRNRPASVKDALSVLTLSPYRAEPESKDLILSGLEMDKLMDPEKYKKTLKELKTPYDKAGRKTAKWETGHGIIKFMAEGFAFMDLEWGFALEGYLTGARTSGRPALTFPKPVCIYKVLSVEPKIPDPSVFKD